MMLTSHSGEESPPTTESKAASGFWVWSKGRRLPDEHNPYPLRKGTREIRRLNLQHSLHRDALGRNHFAPIGHPHLILDVAGGTGIWAREIAREFPRARVETFDKDVLPFQWAVQGLHGTVPANFSFQAGDALARFSYTDARFDYVHARYCSPFLALERWPGMIAEMVRVTRPGGWVEVVDGPAAVSAAPGYVEIEQAIQKLAQQRFGFYDPGPHLQGWLEHAGLLHIHQDVQVIGAGKLAKFQHRLAEMIARACVSIGDHLISGGYITAERFHACMHDLQAEIERAGITVTVHIVYGQKPIEIS